jgi:folylpolyglutamate synthase/dihydropteroate synthase
LENLELTYKDFKSVKDSETYLVFGSFSVVEEFLKQGYMCE